MEIRVLRYFPAAADTYGIFIGGAEDVSERLDKSLVNFGLSPGIRILTDTTI